MCEANAYLLRDGKEELVLESVDVVEPQDGKVYLKSIFGEQKVFDARIKVAYLVDHKILLEEKK
jgi:predicted RNA-binding protein